MKKWYLIGLFLVVIALMGMMVAACGSATTTTAAPETTAPPTTVEEVTTTTAAGAIGMKFKDEGNNVVYIVDEVEPGMAFPISTSNGDFSAKVWAVDASGAKVADFTTLDGYVDYTSVVGKAVKILVQGPFGDPFEYTIPK